MPPASQVVKAAASPVQTPDRASAPSIRLPSFEQVVDDPVLYAHASRILHLETNSGNARALVQRHGTQDVWLNPPPIPLTTTAEMDWSTTCRTSGAAPVLRRRRDPGVQDDPLLDRDPARLLRRLHLLLDHRARGPDHPEPFEKSILREIEKIRDTHAGLHWRDLRSRRADREHVSYGLQEPRDRAQLPPPSRVSGICRNLNTDHAPLIQLYRKARACPASRRC